MTVGAFLGIFALMFVLELPDKTFVATVIMATKAPPSLIVLGGSVALVLQMGIAVGAGSLLTLFPAHWKDLVVGLLFVAGAAYLLFVPESREEEKGEREASLENASGKWKTVTTAFVVLFIGEFGDLTQIQAANFEAKLHQPLEVFLASSLALISVSFLGAYGGKALQRVIPLNRIRLGGGLIFAVLGLWTLISLAVSVS
ncbi:MAG TPA: TMEM165/GDT1 family protein [Acidimicrobiales bacterium]